MASVRRTPSKSGSFRFPIIISAIIHLTIIVLLTTVPELGFSLRGHRPLRIDAIWVDLPRGTSDEIGMGMKKAKGLPRSTIEEQKRLFQTEKTRQEALKPKMRMPPEAEKEGKKKEAVAKRPKIEAKTTKRNKPRQSSANKKMRNALAKIDRQLHNRTIVPEAAQIKEDQNGYKYGTGTKPIKVNPSDPEYLKYQAMVRAKIIREWIIPLKFTEENGPQYSARLEVMINMDGDVVSTRWDSPSGNATFDQSAIRAVKNASPFPTPPDRLAWEAYNEGFLIEFDPRLKTRY